MKEPAAALAHDQPGAAGRDPGGRLVVVAARTPRPWTRCQSSTPLLAAVGQRVALLILENPRSVGDRTVDSPGRWPAP